MSQTDTKTGFRLPWTAERGDGEPSTDGAGGESGSVDAEASMTTESAPADEATKEGGAMEAGTITEEHVTPDMTDATAVSSARRPTKFMADLSRAMQTAAESSRDETMTRFTADAKQAVEDIRAKSAEEAAGLRRQADDDVAAVREWSKAEIARIREETDTRIAARKQALDGEMDAFAAVIEARVQKVNATVGDYETEMAEFFERLLAEQDPTRIATMAQAMPDPPDLSAIAAAVVEVTPQAEPAAEVETVERADAEAAEAAEAMGESTPSDGDAPTEESQAEGTADTADATANGETTMTAEGEAAQYGETETTTEPGEGEAATDAQTAEGETGDAPVAEGDMPAGEPQAEAVEDQPAPDFAAAEAEAAAMSGGLDADDGLSMLAAARLDALAEMPLPEPDGDRQSGDRISTRVVVRGLVSVASIATFKRSLGRVAGVSAIGVASGPDGEFVFTVSHDSSLNLGEAISGLPGFDARIGAESPDGLEVSAHDPDSD
jgi:hypothetical protein